MSKQLERAIAAQRKAAAKAQEIECHEALKSEVRLASRLATQGLFAALRASLVEALSTCDDILAAKNEEKESE